MGDIEKAFLSVGLQKADRDVTRFLWLKDPTISSLENNMQIYRFCHVPFCIIVSPFLLSAKSHITCNEVVTSLLKTLNGTSMLLLGPEGAKALYCEAKSLFGAASMNLREWASKSQEFIPQADQAANSFQKILGIK